MKKLIYILAGLLAAASLWSCNSDDNNKTNWEKYTDWREANQAWFAEQEKRLNPDGTPYFSRLTPAWNPSAIVLVHWFNDRAETQDNLVPMLTSTVETRYMGRLYDDTKFDSTAVDATYTQKVSGLVEGRQIALMNMHVGDSVLVVFPYQQGYGGSAQGSIKPYSALQFNMRLVDIPAYEIP